MHRVVRWVAYASVAWLLVNVLAYPFSFFVPKGGTPLQNFNMALLIGLVIVILFSDVLYIKHAQRLKNFTPLKRDAGKQDLVGTIVEFDYPLFFTDLFLMIEVIAIHSIAF